MTTGPIGFTLRAELDARDIAAALPAAVAHWRAADGLPAPVGWRAGDIAGPIGAAPPAGTDFVAFEFDSPDAAAQLEADSQARMLRLQIDDGPDASRVLPAMRSILVSMARADLLRSATVERLAGGQCLPSLPLVGDVAQIVACSAAAIDQAYQDQSAFFGAWDRTEHAGALWVLSRAMDKGDNPDFLRAVIAGQLAMARGARPGEARIYPPRFVPGELDALNEGEPTLSGVGYHRAGQIYEFAGHLPRGAELRWLDVLTAWRVAKDGKLEDGSPVREVRAVFMDKEQATRARPLLDIAGVGSYWEDSAGLAHQA